MYLLLVFFNKRYVRVGGRKMSGSAFNKFLSRFVVEGYYDFLNLVDFKDYWVKYGINCYIMIK